jgi:hypothetical protein
MRRVRGRIGAMAAVVAVVASVVHAGGGGPVSASGGGMTGYPGSSDVGCVYRPGELIAPPGRASQIRRIAKQPVREITSLVPDQVQGLLPNTVARLSLYDIGTADPLAVAAQANAAGMTAAPNYLSSFAPGVRTWAPGEDAVALPGAAAAITSDPYLGEGLRIGVLDTGLNRKVTTRLPGAGSVTYRSAASLRTQLVAMELVDSGYLQPSELMQGRAAGHGTFITGLIRRALPGASVVVGQVPFRNADDALFDVGTSPGFADQKSSRADDASIAFMMYMAFAPTGVPNVDVLSLSFGSYGCGSHVAPSLGNGEFRTPVGLRSALLGLWELSGRELAVAGAAGNDLTDERFYPAAFAATSCFDPANVPANGGLPTCRDVSRAVSPWVAAVTAPPSVSGVYSNFGPWTTVEADGSDVASVRGDLDWYSWSGTSFAAPCAAMEIAVEENSTWIDLGAKQLDCGLDSELVAP